MRIGILTLYFSYNYGAVLQAYGLQCALERLGVDAEFINYRPVTDRAGGGWRAKLAIVCASPAKVLPNIRGIGVMRRRFDAFRSNRLRQSPVYSSLCGGEAGLANYDGFIAGSDQVWNSGERVEPAYFLSFAADRQRRISYAACFGQESQLPQLSERAPAWLRRFDHLSVRNQLSRDLVRKLSGRDAVITADPTLLADFSGLRSSEPLCRQPYLLVYALDRKMAQEGAAAAQEIKQRLKLPIVSIVPKTQLIGGWTFPGADRHIWSAGPVEWLTLISEAAFVCTDSFHGAIFAAKQRKPLVVYCDGGWRSPRLRDLGARYGLSDRLISGVQELRQRALATEPTDYEPVHRKMAEHAEASLAFLRQGLSVEPVLSASAGG